MVFFFIIFNFLFLSLFSFSSFFHYFRLCFYFIFSLFASFFSLFSFFFFHYFHFFFIMNLSLFAVAVRRSTRRPTAASFLWTLKKSTPTAAQNTNAILTTWADPRMYRVVARTTISPDVQTRCQYHGYSTPSEISLYFR